LASLLPPVGTEFLRPFTSASLEQMSQRKEEEKKQKGKKKDQKVKNNELPKPSEDLEEGKPLPFIFGEPSPAHLNTPLEELDPHQSEVSTFLVLGKGKLIHRFNAHKACCLFGPLNPLRTLAIKILTNTLFSSLIFVTILINFVLTVVSTDFYAMSKIVELSFTAVYLLEVVVKIVSRGFCWGKFTFLRNPWNWPDVGVIAGAYEALFVDFPELKMVSLVLKTFPIFQGLKKTLSSFVQAMKRLSCVLALTAFMLCILSIIGQLLFQGSLRQKCISWPEADHNLTSHSFISHYDDDQSSDFNYYEHVNNPNNSYIPSGMTDALVCGNTSNAGACPTGFTCLRNQKNPNYGYTSFDSFGWALLSSFRLLTQAYWDDLMRLVLRANGKTSFIYFLFLLSPCWFVLVSLMAAVMAAALCERERTRLAEASRKEKEFNQIVKALRKRGGEEAKSDFCVPSLLLEFKQCTDKPLYRYSRRWHSQRVPTTTARKAKSHNQPAKEVRKRRSFRLKPDPRRSVHLKACCDPTSILTLSCCPCCSACAKLLLTWNCCGCWRWLKRWLHTIVTNPFFDLAIVVCLIINIIFTSMEHFPMTYEFAETLIVAELIFIFIYIGEMLLKILAMDPYNYFKVGWNVYESLIVVLSLFEMVLAEVHGLCILVSVTLLRFFRLARWWHEFHVFLKTTLKYSFLLLIVFFGFVAVGYQLFNMPYMVSVCKISEDCSLPRWNMNSFFQTFNSIFKMLFDSWVEILWDCMEVASPAMCLTFVVSVVVIGNLLILHLFLLMLLNPYSSDIVALEERKKNNVEIALGLCKTWILENICPSLGRKGTKSNQTASNGQEKKKKDYVSLNMATSDEAKVRTPEEEGPEHAKKRHGRRSTGCLLQRPHEQKDSEVLREKNDEDQKEDVPESCCCQSCYRCCPVLDVDTSEGAGRCCFSCRKVCLIIVQNFFKLFINVIILLSSTALACEDIYLQHRKVLMAVLAIAELVFALLFFMEMLLKWVGFGFRKYFTDAWCWLEFLIVGVFLLSLVGVGSLETLRVLRVVRILSFLQGSQRVVGTLFRMVPSLVSGTLVILLVWLVFSVVGVQMFAGKFYYCVNETSGEMFHSDVVSNKSECFELTFSNYTEVRWVNPAINYDNVMMGFLSLFILGFSKSWFDIIYSAMDSSLVENQPVYENNPYVWLYFVFFFIAVFFSLNFFIKVLLTGLQKLYFGDQRLFMTQHQQKCSRALMKLFPRSPCRAVPRPQNKCQAGVFDVMNTSCYEIVMAALICLNVLLLVLETVDTTETMYTALHWIYFIFIIIFLLECIFKLVAFRQHYFKDGWNILDFVVVLLQILVLFIEDLVWFYLWPLLGISPDTLAFLRLFRVCRVLHVIPVTRRIRKVLLAFLKSVPALFNIAFVLLVVMVVFSLIGMFNFAYVKKAALIDDVFNFETFCSSMICLFMTSTSAGWGSLLRPFMNSPPDCDPFAEHPGSDVVGDCSTPIAGVAFFASYIILSFLLLIQLYITVVMEIINSEDTETLCDDDLQNFCKTWMTFDPDDTQLIPYSKLSEFSDSLQDPLRIPKPNATRLVHMDLPLYPGDKVHCTDVFLALAKQVLDDAEGVKSLQARLEKLLKANSSKVPDEPVSSTLRRKQEDTAAKVIQRAFRRRHLRRRS
uniref:Sodium channel protein n=1 Tax=Tetraodon nigroviridis TaxID=99883 RepID=H3D8B0_TETNG